MTVSELIDQLKDCAPNAQVVQADGYVYVPVKRIVSDGERVVLS